MMKINIAIILSFLALSATAIVPSRALADDHSMPDVDESMCVMEPQEHIPSGLLAMMAYRGAFEKEGIPGYNAFLVGYKSGRITANKIIAAAVKGCVLDNSTGMAETDGYASMVNTQVENLIREMN